MRLDDATILDAIDRAGGGWVTGARVKREFPDLSAAVVCRRLGQMANEGKLLRGAHDRERRYRVSPDYALCARCDHIESVHATMPSDHDFVPRTTEDTQ